MIDNIKAILLDNSFTTESLPILESKLFFEGARRRAYLVRFVVLLFLSTIIATYGVLSDSTATVIGAMIIAPLMTPILATTAALVMGQPQRARDSATIVLGGVVLVIVVALVSGLLSVGVISVTGNSQISARVAPSLNDLVVALAAGAAAAFAYSRFDVADSLPGVAIAIALVPPLSVVGLCLSAGEWEAALGALLLFTTNLLSILLAGGAVFAMLGLGPASVKSRELSLEAERRVYRFILLGVFLVALPLAATTYRVAHDSRAQLQAHRATRAWIEASDLDLTLHEVSASNGRIWIEVAGAEDSTVVRDSASQLKSSLPDHDAATLWINYAENVPIEHTADSQTQD